MHIFHVAQFYLQRKHCSMFYSTWSLTRCSLSVQECEGRARSPTPRRLALPRDAEQRISPERSNASGADGPSAQAAINKGVITGSTVHVMPVEGGYWRIVDPRRHLFTMPSKAAAAEHAKAVAAENQPSRSGIGVGELRQNTSCLCRLLRPAAHRRGMAEAAACHLRQGFSCSGALA
jgi:hypothetical protein